MATTTANFLHLLWLHLASSTMDPQDRTNLVRNMAARPITVGPINGWSAR